MTVTAEQLSLLVGKFVVVNWIQGTCTDGQVWYPADTIAEWEPDECHSAGWLVAVREKYIAVAASRSQPNGEGDLEYTSINTIPLGCVNEVCNLEKEPEAVIPAAVEG